MYVRVAFGVSILMMWTHAVGDWVVVVPASTVEQYQTTRVTTRAKTQKIERYGRQYGDGDAWPRQEYQWLESSRRRSCSDDLIALWPTKEDGGGGVRHTVP